MASVTWQCPRCGRRVPNRVDECHCGMGREAALAAAPKAVGRGPASPSPAPRRADTLPSTASRGGPFRGTSSSSRLASSWSCSEASPGSSCRTGPTPSCPSSDGASRPRARSRRPRRLARVRGGPHRPLRRPPEGLAALVAAAPRSRVRRPPRAGRSGTGTPGQRGRRAAPPEDPALARALRILQKSPVIDGHNDLPWAIRENEQAPGTWPAYDLRAAHPRPHRPRAPARGARRRAVLVRLRPR